MNPPTSAPFARRTLTSLALPGLIRLVAEIDDNGPIRRGSFAVTFADLSRHQLRSAVESARALGVVTVTTRAPVCYMLTDSGQLLADTYDAAARWARAHRYPTSSGNFVTRVQRTIHLIALDLEDGTEHAPDSEISPAAIADLREPRLALEALIERLAAGLEHTE
ncbi:hypothetical protein [Actinacidiphila sp. bgisy144]|uniref:hypothetical protein n=1 Tax=Actinacidiphila sp. bgisy144 TaxID=3413791 RepID=UPI003EBD23D9